MLCASSRFLSGGGSRREPKADGEALQDSRRRTCGRRYKGSGLHFATWRALSAARGLRAPTGRGYGWGMSQAPLSTVPALRVLVVDDEKNIRVTLSMCLESFG